ncbi:uncharacterized protein LOC115876337 isoform X2 [Sitophilus oryzae]|uniref:Uncharacterized protein LOC115876337 isoform X1 n=1 Tax=Sitophilus oryzae TaxID=7048 RepID=A0A6J2X9R4_SITOR|nr:uncharacterized protein LOC115876337 isoform X1 [Sitophilus oryzae]XP_030747931.1 uncharacterized protein LOC115876337 isoform X2 [Sitophilus oryzae]
MFFISLYIVTITTFIFSGNDAKEIISTTSCKCWENYRADVGENGLQCVALDQFHIMPCNMPKSPKCICSGGISSILKDESGTWCTKYSNGEELRRWPCENRQEWDDFLKKNPTVVMDRYEICKSVRPPNCICSGDLASVAKDTTGIWCIKYDENMDEIRWQCENIQEWSDFKKQHPYYLYC